MIGPRTPKARRLTMAAATISATLSLALVAAAVGAGTAHGETGLLGGYSLRAHALGFEGSYDAPSAQTHPELQGSVPDADASSDTGPLGYALGAILWPGTLVGNGGETIIIGGGSAVPPSLAPTTRKLDDPVRAETRFPAGPGDSSFTSLPGTSMTAHSGPDGSAGSASIPGLSIPGVGTMGAISTKSTTTVGASKGTADAVGRVADVNLFNGLIHIDSVVSTATAQSDTVKGSGSAKTTVNGLKINGVPATVDQDGVHIGSSGTPLNNAAVQGAQKALSQAFVFLLVGAPSEHVQGAHVTETGGSLVIAWVPQGNAFTITLGGATASANASACFDCASLGASLGGSPAGDATVPSSGATPALGGTSDSGLNAGAPAGSSASAAPALQAAPGATGTQTAAQTALIARSGRGNAWWLALLALLAAIGAAAGLRLLADGSVTSASAICDSGGSR